MPNLNLSPLSNPPLNAHYEGAYDERMQRWRTVGALDKVRNIQKTLGDKAPHVETVLEVGCGTGAVLLEMSRLRIGNSHTGVDMADPASHAHTDIAAAGISMRLYDGKRLPFADASFDLVVASHVLEHVHDERGFLEELARVTRQWIYVEVPCEINARMSIRALQSTLNIGHINAYTPETLLLTLRTSGLRPIEMRIDDHSMAVHEFSSGKLRSLLKAGIRRIMLRVNPVWASRIFTYHVSMLCKITPRAQEMDAN